MLDGKYFRLFGGQSLHQNFSDLPEVHRKTPTFTLRKRAGEAPWPVPITCIGSPLPQLGVPQRIQCFWFAMASQEFQKSGVIPAYVQFFNKRPRLPFLIS